MEQQKLNLIDILLAAADFLDSPEDAEKIQAFNDIKAKTVVRTFIPMRYKSIVLQNAIAHLMMENGDLYDFVKYFNEDSISYYIIKPKNIK